MLPLNPKGPVRLTFRMWGDFRKTGAVGGKPSMFSRIRPRPWGKFVVSALVLIRLGFSRPSTAENSLAASVPATRLLTPAEHAWVSEAGPDSSGLAPRWPTSVVR